MRKINMIFKALVWQLSLLPLVISRSMEILERPDRVVGGQEVEEGSYPWQISLQVGESQHYCGATLIEEDWAITAAHCVQIAIENIKAKVGAWDLRLDSNEYRIEEVFTEDFDSTVMASDIALLKLDTKNPMKKIAKASQRAGSLPMASLSTERDDLPHCFVSGWGRLEVGGPLPNIMNAAKVPLRTDEECVEMMGGRNTYELTEKNLCAGGGETDACQGDSGGPLVCCSSETPSDASCILMGITSWGVGCATPDLPGVYTEVAFYKQWAQNIIDNYKK